MAAPVVAASGLWVLPYDPQAFQRLGDGALSEAGDVTAILDSPLTAIEAADGRIAAAHALVKNRPVILRPDAVIDASGDAALCVEMASSASYQIPAFAKMKKVSAASAEARSERRAAAR